MGLLALGILWYITLALCPWVVRYSRASLAPGAFQLDDVGFRLAFCVIGCGVLAISTLVVRRRPVWEMPLQAKGAREEQGGPPG